MSNSTINILSANTAKAFSNTAGILTLMNNIIGKLVKASGKTTDELGLTKYEQTLLHADITGSGRDEVCRTNLSDEVIIPTPSLDISYSTKEERGEQYSTSLAERTKYGNDIPDIEKKRLRELLHPSLVRGEKLLEPLLDRMSKKEILSHSA